MEKKMNHDGQSVNESVKATNVASVEPEKIAIFGLMLDYTLEVYTDTESGHAEFVYETRDDGANIRAMLRKLGYKVLDTRDNERVCLWYDGDTKVMESNMSVNEFNDFQAKLDCFEEMVKTAILAKDLAVFEGIYNIDKEYIMRCLNLTEKNILIEMTLGKIGELDDHGLELERDVWLYMIKKVEEIESRVFENALPAFAAKKDIYTEYEKVNAYQITFDKSRKYID